MPAIPSNRCATSIGNPLPDWWVTVASTKPPAAIMLAWKDCNMVGRIMFMPKITITPKTTARVVRKVRSLRPFK